MCHETQLQAARTPDGGYEFNYVFAQIAPYFQSADYVIGNLETTIVRPALGYAGWPLFRSPPALLDALKGAGVSFLSTSNNHSYDAFAAGVRQTIEHLNERGIPYTGTYLSPEERDETTIIEVNGITFAVIAYTYSSNGLDMGANEFMLKFLYTDRIGQAMREIDRAQIKGDIARAKALEPDFIVVLPHTGVEYYGTLGHSWHTFDRRDRNWADWMDTLQFLLEAGADIIMAHHPHTLLPAEFVYVTDADGTVRKCFVAYSMANFVSGQRTQPREASAIFYLTVKKEEGGKAIISEASYTPTWVRETLGGRYDFTVLPVSETLRRVDEGDSSGLRASDIARLRQVHTDVTFMLSGSPADDADLFDEYIITRERTIDVYPGKDVWGDLPWS
jgi:poly-gamma-glutamate synthesis protein (capsule biosynthesis protein)